MARSRRCTTGDDARGRANRVVVVLAVSGLFLFSLPRRFGTVTLLPLRSMSDPMRGKSLFLRFPLQTR